MLPFWGIEQYILVIYWFFCWNMLPFNQKVHKFYLRGICSHPGSVVVVCFNVILIWYICNPTDQNRWGWGCCKSLACKSRLGGLCWCLACKACLIVMVMLCNSFHRRKQENNCIIWCIVEASMTFFEPMRKMLTFKLFEHCPWDVWSGLFATWGPRGYHNEIDERWQTVSFLSWCWKLWLIRSTRVHGKWVTFWPWICFVWSINRG